MYVNHSFHKAIRLNKIRCVKRMLRDNKVDMSACHLGLSWIHHCIVHSNSTFELIANHPNVNPNVKSQVDNLTPLVFAIKQQNVSACLSLLKHTNTIVDDDTLQLLLTFIVDYGVKNNINYVIMEVLENPKCNVVVIPNYSIFTSVLSSSKICFNHIKDAILRDNGNVIQPSWYAKFVKEQLQCSLQRRHITGIDRVIQLNRELIEDIKINNNPIFVYCLNTDNYQVFELCVKHKLNPNVHNNVGVPLLHMTARMFERDSKYLKLLLFHHPNININNVMDSRGSLLSITNCNIDVFMSHPKFRISTPIANNLMLFHHLCSSRSSTNIYKKLLIKFITELCYVQSMNKHDVLDRHSFRYDSCGEIIQRLIDEYLHNNDAVYKWIADVEEPISYAFVLTVLLSDGYLVVKTDGKTREKTKIQQPIGRWFNIASQLPMELQMLLCHRTFGSTKQFVHSKVVNCVVKNILAKYQYDSRHQTTNFNYSGSSLLMNSNIVIRDTPDHDTSSHNNCNNNNILFDNKQTYGLPPRNEPRHGTLPVQFSIHR